VGDNLKRRIIVEIAWMAFYLDFGKNNLMDSLIMGDCDEHQKVEDNARNRYKVMIFQCEIYM